MMMTFTGSVIHVLSVPAVLVAFLALLTMSTLFAALTKHQSASRGFYYVVSVVIGLPGLVLAAMAVAADTGMQKKIDPLFGIFTMLGLVPVVVLASVGWLAGLLFGTSLRMLIPINRQV